MAVLHPHLMPFRSTLSSPPSTPAASFLSLRSSIPRKFQIFATSSPMEENSQNPGPPSSLNFPFLSAASRDLMVDIVSTAESRLHPHLLPCTLPPDVQSYRNQSGTSHGSLLIRSGRHSSPIDFILGSWIHADLPSGGALDIATLSAYLNSSTDAPHFLIELIRSGPASLIVILDLPPRKDLVFHPDYLQTFYEANLLDRKRQLLEDLPEVQAYLSPSLFIRCAFSPTAILVRISGGTSERVEEIVSNVVARIAMEVFEIWLHQCAFAERVVAEDEKLVLKKRDQMFKNKAVETDLGSSFPMLFGPEVASRVLQAILEVSNA